MFGGGDHDCIMDLANVWPLFGLRIRTNRLTLRLPTDDDLAQLLDLVVTGIHPPETMPFEMPWTDVESPTRERESLQYWWACRSGFSPGAWDLPLCVEYEGNLIGVQNLTANDFVNLRQAETGSWLGMAHQGKGFGKEMRRASLYLAFECLGAKSVVSSAFVDNVASQRVSMSAGYEPNGVGHKLRRGERAEQQRFLMTAERWRTFPAPSDESIQLEGFEASRSMFGV